MTDGKGAGRPARFRSVDPLEGLGAGSSTSLRANGTPTPRDGFRLGGGDDGEKSGWLSG